MKVAHRPSRNRSATRRTGTVSKHENADRYSFEQLHHRYGNRSIGLAVAKLTDRQHFLDSGGDSEFESGFRQRNSAREEVVDEDTERPLPRVDSSERAEREAEEIARSILTGSTIDRVSRLTNTSPIGPSEPKKVDGLSGNLSRSDQQGSEDIRAIAARAIDRHRTGRAIPVPIRDRLEASFGQDLSSVRIHDDPIARADARAMNATAFAHGNDVWLGPDVSSMDLGIIAHEVTHVLQQGSSERAVVQRQESDDTPSWTVSPFQAIRNVNVGTGTVFEAEAILRQLYNRADEAIAREAAHMIEKLRIPEEMATRWAVDARNRAKGQIRRFDQEVIRVLAEQRNVREYGHRLGPSYEQLRYGDPEFDIPPRSDPEIREGITKTNRRANRWAGRLRIAGRIMIAVDIGIGAYNVISAPESERPRTLAREVGTLTGAAGGGWAGAKLGGMAGASIGSLFGGVGAAPGAAIGGVIGGIAGAIGGGLAGREAGELIYDTLYPPEETRFEGAFL